MPGPRLTLPERAQIEVLFGQGLTVAAIGVVIDRDRSTVWRELRRNQIRRGRPPAAPATRTAMTASTGGVTAIKAPNAAPTSGPAAARHAN